MPETERLRNIGKIMGAGILALALNGDLEPQSFQPPQESGIQTGHSVTLLEIMDPLSIATREIETKYGIEIVSQEQAYKDLKIPLKEAPATWQFDQIMLLGDLVSQLPKTLIEPYNGKSLRIFVANFGAECGCGGIDYRDSGYIGMASDTFNQNYKDVLLEVLAHENTHRFYFSGNQNAIDAEITGLMGDLNILRMKVNFGEKNASPQNDLAVDALASLLNEGGRRIFPEGVARISEIYVKGPRVFQESLGPYLNSDLLYTYWKDTFFDQLEY